MKSNELTEKEIKKLQKKFPQIKKKVPKKRLTKEEIQYRQVQRKANCRCIELKKSICNNEYQGSEDTSAAKKASTTANKPRIEMH